MKRPPIAAKQRLRRKESGRIKALEKRIALARELAASPTTTVTLRVPMGLNEWLDAYLHAAWPQKVRKQERVTEALRLLIARRGAAEDGVLATDLVGDCPDVQQRTGRSS